jgi:hypothetical protein
MASSSSEWFDTSVEDGNLYARALALGANNVVLATKERTLTYLSVKDAASGKSPPSTSLLSSSSFHPLFDFIFLFFSFPVIYL